METADKAKIIEAVQETDDERVLLAIMRLLLIKEDADIPDRHKEELDSRNKRIDASLKNHINGAISATKSNLLIKDVANRSC